MACNRVVLGWRRIVQELGQHSKRCHSSAREPSRGGNLNAKAVRELCHEGRIDEAFKALEAIRHQGLNISKTLCSVLQRCPESKKLAICKHVDSLAIRAGLESDTNVAGCIIQAYASIGCLQEASDVFHRMASPDKFVWASIISAHNDFEQHQKAIELYHKLQQSTTVPSGYVFVAVLKACAESRDLTSGQLVHADVIHSRFESDLYVGTALVSMYVKCGNLNDAQKVFDKLSTKNIVTWSALIAGYVQKGLGQEALDLYERMERDGIAADTYVLVSVLQACGSTGALQRGRETHAHILKHGLEGQHHIGSALVDMYVKFGSLQDACSVFGRLARKTLVSCNVMILACAQSGLGHEALDLYNKMERSGVSPSISTFIAIMQACRSIGALKQGKEIHEKIMERGLEGDLQLGSSIVDMYVKCGSLEDARKVFDRLSVKDLFTWHTMLAGYAHHGLSKESLAVYDMMQQDGVAADSLILCSILQACGSLGTLSRAKQIHADILKRGLERELHIGGTLVETYVRCRSLQDAFIVFDRLATRNLATWNVMIRAYALQGLGHESLKLWKRMEQNEISPDAWTFVSILQACGNLGALQEGKDIHTQIFEKGLGENLHVGNSLVHMYAKCGSLEDARKVFVSLPSKDVITWTAMIRGYAQHGLGQDAMNLYEAMQHDGVSGDAVTFSVLLQVCSGMRSLEQGKRIHQELQDRGLEGAPYIGSSLLDMYAKCGSLEDARTVFDRLQSRDIVTWNAMIGGYAQHGLGLEALDLYESMQEKGFVADSVTMLAILQVCSTMRDIETGKEVHEQILAKGLDSDPQIGSGLLDMYAKCGSLEDARTVFDSLPLKDVVTWGALIRAYAQHGLGKEALSLYDIMQHDGIPGDSHIYVSLLQVCGGMKTLQEGKRVHEQILEHGIEGDSFIGRSLVDMYAKCGSLTDARTAFDRLTVKDSAAWKAIIGLYSTKGYGQEALDLYESMQQHGIVADSFLFVSLLQACCSIRDLQKGKEIHAKTREIGIEGDLHVGISLVNMYTKCESPMEAKLVLSNLLTQDIVGMVGGYSLQMGDDDPLKYCERIGVIGMSADTSTLVSTLQACSSIGAIEMAKKLHADIQVMGLEQDPDVGSALVNMYVECGRVEDARAVFDRTPTTNLSTWNAVLKGYVLQGLYQEALDLADKMQEARIPADEFTFASILQACKQVGHVDHRQLDIISHLRETNTTPDQKRWQV